MAVNVKLIRVLREKTNAGMNDCKKALEASDNDVDAAVDWLRKKGVASASKLSSRVSAEGVIGVALQGSATAVMYELNSETDFVARNAKFQSFASSVGGIALTAPTMMVDAECGAVAVDVAAMMNENVPDVLTNEAVPLVEGIKTLSANMGENVMLSRAYRIDAGDNGVLGRYVHNQLGEDMGTLGAVVSLQAATSPTPEQYAGMTALANMLAMHVVGTAAQFLSVESCKGSQALAKERAIAEDVAAKSGKPANIVEKMVDGRLRKFYEEVVLLEQKSVVHEGSPKMAAVLKKSSKELGVDLSIASFARLKLGASAAAAPPAE